LSPPLSIHNRYEYTKIVVIDISTINIHKPLALVMVTNFPRQVWTGIVSSRTSTRTSAAIQNFLGFPGDPGARKIDGTGMNLVATA